MIFNSVLGGKGGTDIDFSQLTAKRADVASGMKFIGAGSEAIQTGTGQLRKYDSNDLVFFNKTSNSGGTFFSTTTSTQTLRFPASSMNLEELGIVLCMWVPISGDSTSFNWSSAQPGTNPIVTGFFAFKSDSGDIKEYGMCVYDGKKGLLFNKMGVMNDWTGTRELDPEFSWDGTYFNITFKSGSETTPINIDLPKNYNNQLRFYGEYRNY